MVKNLPCNTGDESSIPGLGAKIPHALEQPSPFATLLSLRATARVHVPQGNISDDAMKIPYVCSNLRLNAAKEIDKLKKTCLIFQGSSWLCSKRILTPQSKALSLPSMFCWKKKSVKTVTFPPQYDKIPLRVTFMFYPLKINHILHFQNTLLLLINITVGEVTFYSFLQANKLRI